MTRRLLAMACVLFILISGAGFHSVGAAYNPPTVESPKISIPIDIPTTINLSQFVTGGSGQFLYSWEPCDPGLDEFGTTTVDAASGDLTFTPNDLFTIYGASYACFTVSNTVPVMTPIRGSIDFRAIYPLQAGDGSFEVDPRNTLMDRLNPLVSGGTEDPTFSLESSPSHGSVVISPSGDFTYQPDGGPWSQDSFTYRVTDSNGNSDTGAITIALVYDTSVPSYGSVGGGGTGDGGGQSTDARSPGTTSPTESDDSEDTDDTSRGSDSCGRCN